MKLFLVVLTVFGVQGSLNDFQIMHNNTDHTTVRFIQYGTTRVVETFATDDTGLSLLEVLNEHVFGQMIFDKEDNLVDCDFITTPTSPAYSDGVKRVKKIMKDLLTNFTIKSNTLVPRTSDMPKPTLFQELKMDLFELPVDLQELLDVHEQVRQCEQLQSKYKLEMEIFKLRQKTELPSSNRVKRGLDSLLTWPGTKWCGDGARANNFDDVGELKADQCCRKHDTCPFYVPGITKKYHYFNWRFTTLSYCQCDDEFYDCLNDDGSGASNMLKKIYFEFMSIDCFSLRLKEMCLNYSFWGKCLDSGMDYVAEVMSLYRYRELMESHNNTA